MPRESGIGVGVGTGETQPSQLVTARFHAKRQSAAVAIPGERERGDMRASSRSHWGLPRLVDTWNTMMPGASENPKWRADDEAVRKGQGDKTVAYLRS